MIDQTSFIEQPPKTEAQRRVEQAMADHERDQNYQRVGSTWIDRADAAFSAAVGSNYQFLLADGLAESMAFKTDPSYSIEKDWERLTDGIPQRWWEAFGSARSSDHANWIKLKLLEKQDRLQTLADTGMTGTAAQVMAGISDPVVLIAGLTTSGFALPGRVATVGGMIRNGLVAATPFSALSTYRYLNDPDHTAVDVIKDSVGGFALGAVQGMTAGMSSLARFSAQGAANAAPSLAFDMARDENSTEMWKAAGIQFAIGGIFGLVGGDEEAAFRNRMREVGNNMHRDGLYHDISAEAALAKADPASTLTPKGQQAFTNQANPEPRLTAIAATGETAETSVHTPDAPKPESATSSGGAASAASLPAEAKRQQMIRDIVDQKQPHDFFPDTTDPGTTRFAWTTKSVFGRLLSSVGRVVGLSDDPNVRAVASSVLPDPVPREGQHVRDTGHDWVRSRTEGDMAEFNSRFDAAYAKHLNESKAAGVPPMSREEFGEAAIKAVRRSGSPAPTASIEAARNLYRKTVDKVLEVMKRHGVPYAEDVNPNSSYATRLWNRVALEEANSTHGANALLDAIEAAITPFPGASPTIRRSLAKAIWDHAMLGEGTNQLQSSSLLLKADALLDRIDQMKSLTPTERSALQDFLTQTQKSSDSGAVSRTRHRIQLDETYVHTLPNGQKLSIESLLHNDMESLVSMYVRQGYGASAVHEILRQTGINFRGQAFPSIDSLSSWLRQNRAIGPGIDSRRFDSDLSQIETGLHVTAGHNINALDPRLNSALRSIQNLNFAAAMSNPASGLTNMMEIGGVLSEFSTKAVLRSASRIREVFKTAPDGSFTTQEARDLAMMGLGLNRRARSTSNYSMEEAAHVTTVESATSKAARLASDVSLQSFGQDAMERVTGLTYMQHWGDVANGSTPMPSIDRLRGNGLTADGAARIVDQINTHGVRGSDGITQLNLDQWADKEAALLFTRSARIAVHRMVQKGDVLALPGWLSTSKLAPVGKILAQLRTFNLQSLSGKLLYEASMRDVQTFKYMATTSILAGAGYIGTVYIRSAGRPDREKYIAENLTPDRIIKAGVSRAAWSSVLPGMVDTMANWTGHDEVFSYARNTGLQGDFILGNPTVNWWLAAQKVPRAAYHLFGPGTFTKQDMKAIRDGAWIPNALGVRGIIESYMRGLPSETK